MFRTGLSHFFQRNHLGGRVGQSEVTKKFKNDKNLFTLVRTGKNKNCVCARLGHASVDQQKNKKKKKNKNKNKKNLGLDG